MHDVRVHFVHIESYLNLMFTLNVCKLEEICNVIQLKGRKEKFICEDGQSADSLLKKFFYHCSMAARFVFNSVTAENFKIKV